MSRISKQRGESAMTLSPNGRQGSDGGLSVPSELLLSDQGNSLRKRTSYEDDSYRSGNSKQPRRRGTEVYGTKRYNPFALGSMRSKFSLAKSLNLIKPKQSKTKHVFNLYLNKGWFDLMKASEVKKLRMGNTKKMGKMAGLLRLSRTMQVEDGGMLSARQVAALNMIAASARMDKLSQDEIRKIECKIRNEKPGQKIGCFKFIKSTWKFIVTERQERTLSQIEVEPLIHEKPAHLNKGECIICGFVVAPHEQLGLRDGNPEGDPLAYGCVTCELSREKVSKLEAFRLRQDGLPCLTAESKQEITGTIIAQKKYFDNLPTFEKREFIPLFPPDRNLFIPVTYLKEDGDHGKGVIAMCHESGLQIRRGDRFITNDEGFRVLEDAPIGKKLLNRFRDDAKTVLAGFNDVIELQILGQNPLLRKPLAMNCIFKQDKSSKQYVLSRMIKSRVVMTYHLSSEVSSVSIDLGPLDFTTVVFEASLKMNTGPFLRGKQFLIQEEDSRLTGNKVILKGRFLHGLLYEWSMDLVLNEEANTLSPIELELALHIPH